jgi:hypothetical protein
MRELQASIEISTSAERVWQILTDFAAYPDWNPFIRRISGSPEPGARLEVRLEPPGARAMTFRPRVIAAQPNRELRWLGQLFVPGLFSGEHLFLIEPIDVTRVRFVQRERFGGVLVPFTRKTLAATRTGFEHMNLALKSRSERGAVS